MPNQLREGRRSLLQIQECDILSDYSWNSTLQVWLLNLRLSCSYQSTEHLPNITQWYVSLPNSYPIGVIKIYPDISEGIKVTYKHQSYNYVDKRFPFGMGDICVNKNLAKWIPLELQEEPTTASTKLAWYIQRAILWLDAASNSELSQKGEPFELPPLPVNKGSTIIFNETTSNLIEWNTIFERAGVFTYSLNAHIPHSCFLQEIKFQNRGSIKHSYGITLNSTIQKTNMGIWIKLDSIPVVFPWSIPSNWDELSKIVKSQGIDIFRILTENFKGKELNKFGFIIFGFPISAHVGDDFVRMHWLCAEFNVGLKMQSKEDKYLYNERAVKHLLRQSNKIEWLISENWGLDDFSSRGSLSYSFSKREVLIIGAGSVGSSLANTLVRLGLSKLHVVDNDKVKVGNLVRHILGIYTIGKSKALELATYLNSINPHSVVKGYNCSIEDLIRDTPGILENVDLIIDATGSNEVLHVLAESNSILRPFISVSLGFGANKLYCFVSPNGWSKATIESFINKIAPWVRKDNAENPKTFKMEGVGCWSPVFPARYDDILLLTNSVISIIENFDDNFDPKLYVLERSKDIHSNFATVNCFET